MSPHSSTGPCGTDHDVPRDEHSVRRSVLRDAGLSSLDQLPELRFPLLALATPLPRRDVAGTALALCFQRGWHCCAF